MSAAKSVVALLDPEAADDVEMALLENAVSAIDRLRRELAHGCIPIATVYAEGARGNLEHVREALASFRRKCAAPGWVFVDDDLDDDEARPPGRDVGCDLLSDAVVRADAGRPAFAGRLASALASNEFLHLASGARWSTDASGAAMLVSMLNGSRPFPLRRDDGVVQPDIAAALVRHGWRRMRSSAKET